MASPLKAFTAGLTERPVNPTDLRALATLLGVPLLPPEQCDLDVQAQQIAMGMLEALIASSPWWQSVTKGA